MADMNIEKLHKIFLKERSVSIDTRTLKAGDIFFALKGPNFNGNKYADIALEHGAAVVVVDNDQLEGVQKKDTRYYLVDDALKTLQGLARFHRDQSKAQIIGITGSNGKTTTKELIAAVLDTQFDIIYTQGNLNNHIGVPLTLLRIKENTEIAIVEMGANHVGEIAELSSIAKPDFGLITNIGKAHIEGFGSIEGIKRGKGELYQAIKKSGGHLFVNASDITLEEMAGNYDQTTYYSQEYGFGEGAISFDVVEGSLEVYFEWKDKLFRERTNLYGDYNIPNILVALCIGSHFQVPPTMAITAIANYMPQNSRSQRLKTKTNEIYLDAYNANPTSMEHALRAFAKVNAPNKVVILGDMFELGDQSEVLHQEIADLASTLFNQVIYLGKNFYKVETESPKYPTTDDYGIHLSKDPFSDVTILLKGSRGMALEGLIDQL